MAALDQSGEALMLAYETREAPAGPESFAGGRVRELATEDEGRWDSFVDACPEATFFHRAGWRRAIESSLRHKTFYLYAEDAAGNIAGVLPLVYIRSPFFGRSLTSSAFCVYGGPATTNASCTSALTSRALEIAQRLGVAHLEFRGRRATQTGWLRKSDVYATFRRALDESPEKNLLAIPRKQRAMVRKGIAAGLVSELDAGVDRLWAIYAESVRNLGTPVFPKGFFRALQKEFGADCQVLTVLHDGSPVSSVMSFFFRDEVLPYYGGGTYQARDVAANDFMYWEVMRRAVERGARLFDFGRSKYGTGAFSFKTHWGFEPEPLHYEYWLLRGSAVPDVTPLNPKYRLFIDAWKRLPLAVTNRVGPLIARDLG
jgi:FemAB-related protein (PEP-CTERM system-associated)